MFPEGFSKYQQAVIQYLHFKGYVHSDLDKENGFTSDVIPHYPDVFQYVISHCPELNPHVISNSGDVIPHFPERWVSTGSGQWLDIFDNVCITPNDPMFDLFFAYRLSQCDIMDVDGLLDAFILEGITVRFITLVLLKHESLFSSIQVKVINQWIDICSSRPQKERDTCARIKGRPKRQAGDRFTSLSQEQTALLIVYLQKYDVTFKGEYLNNSQAAQAFELLTGYSAEKLRKVLTKEELARISDKRNMTELLNILNKLTAGLTHDIKNTNS